MERQTKWRFSARTRLRSPQWRRGRYSRPCPRFRADSTEKRVIDAGLLIGVGWILGSSQALIALSRPPHE